MKLFLHIWQLWLKKSKHNNMASVSARDPSKDSELHVSFEDQQKINKFACHNAKLDDIIEELKAKEHEMEALQDAELDMMSIDDDDKVPFKVGDVFVFFTTDQAQEMMEEKKTAISQEISSLRDKQEQIGQVMSDLKVQLYAKFGNNINLEPE